MFKRVGSRSSHRPFSIARTPPVSSVGSGFFRLGWDFLALAQVFSGWVGFWVKNMAPYLIHELLQVKNYGLYLPVALVGSDRAEFFSGRIGLGWSD
jgi:hypothetical protein